MIAYKDEPCSVLRRDILMALDDLEEGLVGDTEFIERVFRATGRDPSDWLTQPDPSVGLLTASALPSSPKASDSTEPEINPDNLDLGDHDMGYFGSDPFTKSVNVDGVLNFLYSETADEDLVRRFACEYFDSYETAQCDSCGFEVPCVEIDGTLTCMLCRAGVERNFVVLFTFSVNVKAANEDAATEIAENAVSVSVDESDKVTDNYDTEVYYSSEQF